MSYTASRVPVKSFFLLVEVASVWGEVWNDEEMLLVVDENGMRIFMKFESKIRILFKFLNIHLYMMDKN